MDLDGWTYYNLPVVGQPAYLSGDRKKQTLDSVRLTIPKVSPAEFAENFDPHEEDILRTVLT